MGDVSITQLNDALSGGHQATPARVDSDPPFGTHIREAVAIVKDWMRDR
jgi:hypothetical protein